MSKKFKADSSFVNLPEKYGPYVRFQIPSELRTGEYLIWLRELFADFIINLSMSNEMTAEQFRWRNLLKVGEEDGVSGLQLDGMYFDYCKLHAYDGEHRRNISDWKGIAFHDHHDKRSQVKPIYLLTEKFEDFLQKRNIPYQRFGHRIIGNHSFEEEEQVTESSKADQTILHMTFGEFYQTSLDEEQRLKLLGSQRSRTELAMRVGMDSCELCIYHTLTDAKVRHLVRYMSFEKFMRRYPEFSDDGENVRLVLQTKGIEWE